jgi:hypothetical protein
MFYKRQSGNVLLLALLVMAGLITAGIGIGAIILNEIKQAQNIDFSVLAYYAAESSSENALYKLRKENVVLTCPVGNCEPTGYCSGGAGEACLYSSGTLTNSATWTRKVADRDLAIYGKIKKDDVLQIDLYDPDQIAWATGVESVKVEWSDSCGNCSQIELAFVDWNPGVGVDWTNNRTKYLYSALESPVINNAFTSAKAYKVIIKALYGDINNLTFTAWSEDNAAGEQKEIPAHVVLNSTGTFAVSKQAIKMTMPRRSPMSGLYDFVLFTECSLVKGEEPTCP